MNHCTVEGLVFFFDKTSSKNFLWSFGIWAYYKKYAIKCFAKIIIRVGEESECSFLALFYYLSIIVLLLIVIAMNKKLDEAIRRMREAEKSLTTHRQSDGEEVDDLMTKCEALQTEIVFLKDFNEDQR